MINFSFAVTVCDESFELKRLLTQLKSIIHENDEIIVQVDNDNTTQDVLDVLYDFKIEGKVFYSLNKDFADFKNNIKRHCNKEYIFFIDADEEVNKDQIEMIRQIIYMNPSVDCYLVPRINTVAGLTDIHIKKWGWRVNENGWINWPDVQSRICKNKLEIQWEGKVHERLTGCTEIAVLPEDAMLALHHHKIIEKQEKQNNFYNGI